MSNCSNLFYELNNSCTLFVRITLSEQQLKLAREGRDSLLNFVKPKLSEVFDLPVKHWIQGSLKNHTLIRPASKFEEFDIDVGIYIVGEGEVGDIDAADVKSDLHDAVLDYCQFDKAAKVPDEIKPRCERVVFDNHFHIDLPLYYFDSIREQAVLATADGWEESDPKGFQDWFDENVAQSTRPYVRRVIKYLKSWVALKGLTGSAKLLPSMALTILAAEFSGAISCNDDEADFAAVAILVANRILESEQVLNPLTGSDVLGLSDSDLAFWKPHLRQLEYVAKTAMVTEDKYSSYYLWEQLFGHMLPPINESALSSGIGGLPAVTKPVEVEVSHFNSKDVLISNELSDSVISYKNESLAFKIGNVSSYPQGATVTWIVRNQGGEAADSNDLGHNTPLDLSEEINRGCAYTGVHYMDATVSYNGSVIGVGKVKVNILPYTRPVKNPLRRRIFKGKK